jgi:urease subunit beta
VSTPIGGFVLADTPIIINEGRPRITMKVRNTGDRPIQIGSHFHFFEVNRALEFDRTAAFGMRLDISASTAIRFEPGDEKEVDLVPFGGDKRVTGFNDLVNGWIATGASTTYQPVKIEALLKAKRYGFKTTSKEEAE